MGSQRGHRALGLKLGGRHGPMLFFQLAPTLALLAFNAFALLKRQHLLVLDPQLPSLKLEVVQNLDHRRCFLRGCEVRECQSPKHAVVKMVVERIRQRQIQLGHQLYELLLFNSEGNVLDNDRRRNQLIVGLGGCGCFWAHRAALEGPGSKIREGIRHTRLLIKPGLVSYISQIIAEDLLEFATWYLP